MEVIHRTSRKKAVYREIGGSKVKRKIEAGCLTTCLEVRERSLSVGASLKCRRGTALSPKQTVTGKEAGDLFI